MMFCTEASYTVLGYTNLRIYIYILASEYIYILDSESAQWMTEKMWLIKLNINIKKTWINFN